MTNFHAYERQVIAWIAEWGHVPVSDLTPDTRIEGIPLRITGDDVLELFRFLQDRSGVDFHDFDFIQHFHTEDVFGVREIILGWLGRWPKIVPGTVRTISQFMFERRPH